MVEPEDQLYATPDDLARHARAPVIVCKLLFAAADGHRGSVRAIRSSDKDEEVVRQRRAVIWAAKFHTSASLPEIGRALNRDHSAVQRSLEETKILWLADPDFRDMCERIARRGARKWEARCGASI